MGCERESAMEGLSDHLLALRAVLEGHGPVGASLPMRASALIADENYDRIAARERMEEVLELERALMHGSTLDRAIELATWIEDGARRLLRKAALGELGPDLSTIADETLITTGLDAGDAEITVFAQDDFPDVEATFADEEEGESTSFAVIEETPAEEFKVVEFPTAKEPTPEPEAEAEEAQIFDGLADDIREAELYLGDEPELEQEDEEHGNPDHGADPGPRRDQGHRDRLARRGLRGAARQLTRVARPGGPRPPAPRAHRHPARASPLPGPGRQLGPLPPEFDYKRH